jgi:hypothetical protein
MRAGDARDVRGIRRRRALGPRRCHHGPKPHPHHRGIHRQGGAGAVQVDSPWPIAGFSTLEPMKEEQVDSP